MTFYDRLEQLCIENGTTPQNKELRDIFGVSSGTITNWKKTGANPEKISTYINIAKHFGVTIDYLSGMTECRTLISEISSDESAVLEKFRKLDIDGKAEVIHVANEQLRRMEKTRVQRNFDRLLQKLQQERTVDFKELQELYRLQKELNSMEIGVL